MIIQKINDEIIDELFDRYANAFNQLAEKLETAGIDLEELSEVVGYAQDFERINPFNQQVVLIYE